MAVKKNTNFWIGTEVEGRFKGLKTLFVKGDQTIESIERIYDNNFLNTIYFGAGHQTPVKNFNTILYFANLNSFPITLEVSEERLHLLTPDLVKHPNMHIIVTFKNKYIPYLKPTDTIKIEDEKNVYCMSKCNFYHTEDTEYVGDVPQ